MRVAVAIELTEEERAKLTLYVRGATTPQRLVKRAQVVLLAAQGMANQDIAERVGMARGPVGMWRRRFAEGRLAGIEKDAPRPGNPSPDRAELTEKILAATTQAEPEHATHWSTRTLAEDLGVSDTRVARVWRAHGLQPHRVKTFKLAGPEKGRLESADTGFHEREHERLVIELGSAAEKSKLPELPAARDALNDLLVRRRLGEGAGRR